MSSCLETIHLPHLPPTLPIHIALYRDLQNASFLRQQLIAGNTDFEYALIDASMVLSRTHILAAVFRAVNDYLNGHLRSRNVHSEIVLSLSPAKNIADAFRKFGITDSTKDLLVVKVPVSPEITHESVAAHLGEHVKGIPVRFNDATLSSTCDVAKIKKAYKLGALATPPAKYQVDGVHDGEKRLLEVSLLGAIALRGS
ncbi:hypothetical protein MPDQ_002877 [Monascus purpureus]|uniref:EKC/KEOPS complex subunit CGI121 n=1 Tax=Monascus purpureus TaxID=5098 RepID=A0A507QM51_MONPU|nr:hypothetical protein MPDQ_002877 [Monascus purpureus]BDD59850.1 hypothetical protein MAP00_005033 [Monascus purpureus]